MDDKLTNGGTTEVERADTATTATEAKRGPGRPRGYAKTGGRASGRRNIASKQAKEEARQTLDRHGSRIINKLVSIALGHKAKHGKEWRAPSEQSQMKALEILSRKLMPDLQASELKADIDVANSRTSPSMALFAIPLAARPLFINAFEFRLRLAAG